MIISNLPTTLEPCAEKSSGNNTRNSLSASQSDQNAHLNTEESSFKKIKSKDDFFLNFPDALDFTDLQKRVSKDSIDTNTLENFLDKDFLRLINSPSIKHVSSRNSFNNLDDLRKNPLKKLKTFCNFEKKNNQLEETDINNQISMENVNLKKKKTETNNFSLSPLFRENPDDDFTNHSFSSEIHLKNNKNFIPKEQIYRNIRCSIGSQEETSNNSSVRNSDKCFNSIQQEENKPSTFSTINFYTSANTNSKFKNNCFNSNIPIRPQMPFHVNNYPNSSGQCEYNEERIYNPFSSLQYYDENQNPNIFSNNYMFSNNTISNIPPFCNPTYNNLYNSNPIMNQNHNSNYHFKGVFKHSTPKNCTELSNQMPHKKMMKIHLNPNSVEYKPQSSHQYTSSSPKQNKVIKHDAEQSEKKVKINSNYDEMNDEELANSSYALAKDQQGCRYLQKKIEENAIFGNDYIFPKIKNHVTELSNDSFGNYLIQKVLEYLNEDNLYQVLDIMKPNMLNLCLNPHGTRVIQRLIEFLKTERIIDKFIECVKPIIIDLVKDINGNHIIQKFVLLVKKNDFIYEILIANYVIVATDKHGCCVLQKCIEVSNPKFKSILVNLIVNNTVNFITDQYGNYVIQYIISLNNHEINRKITNYFINNIGFLGKQKFSSNVIEKVFEFSDEKTKELMVAKLSDPEIVQTLLFDMYGNYVIQKALSVAKEPHYSKYIQTIVPIIDKLKTVSFGPKLYHKLINTYREIGNLLDQRNMMKMNTYNNMTMSQYNLKKNFQNININFNPPQRNDTLQQINNFYFHNN